MSFLPELGMVCFFRAQSKAIQQLRGDWVAVVSETQLLLASKPVELKEREES